MKWWPIAILASLILYFIGNYNLKENKYVEMLDDGCLVQSLYFHQSTMAKEMLEQFMWTRVLCMHYHGSIEGHAVTVFIYKNITWVYDPNRGSFPVAQFPLYDPLMIAELAFPKLFVKKAYYIEPTLLLNYTPGSSKMVW